METKVSMSAKDDSYGVELAFEALERIANHEKECGKRWSEAIVELRGLKNATDLHAARWEKLMWVFVGTLVTCTLTVLSTVII